jgi:hypothetical protein
MAPRDDGREGERHLSDDERPRHYIDTGKRRGRDGAAAPSAPSAPRGRESPRDEGKRDATRRDSVRRDIDKATGRAPRGPNDDRRARPADSAKPAGKGRVLRVKSKTAIPPAVPAAKPKPRRMTVKKTSPKADE